MEEEVEGTEEGALEGVGADHHAEDPDVAEVGQTAGPDTAVMIAGQRVLERVPGQRAAGHPAALEADLRVEVQLAVVRAHGLTRRLHEGVLHAPGPEAQNRMIRECSRGILEQDSLNKTRYLTDNHNTTLTSPNQIYHHKLINSTF